MGIETQRDPRTKKEITFVSGKLEKIYVNPWLAIWSRQHTRKRDWHSS